MKCKWKHSILISQAIAKLKLKTLRKHKTEFWRLIQEELPLPKDIYEIQGIQKKELDK